MRKITYVHTKRPHPHWIVEVLRMDDAGYWWTIDGSERPGWALALDDIAASDRPEVERRLAVAFPGIRIEQALAKSD